MILEELPLPVVWKQPEPAVMPVGLTGGGRSREPGPGPGPESESKRLELVPESMRPEPELKQQDKHRLNLLAKEPVPDRYIF